GTGEWTDPAVGGLILAGLVITALFIWIESRAADPIVPLGLFRIRNFSVSVTAMFFAAFGFFGAVIFLPRWLQTVGGASATISGYNLLPLVGGLIVSATMSGQIVARTGKYKILMLVSLVMLALGLVLMTNLTADTPRPVLWFWMVIAGLGIGPSFAVFTLVVQNSVNAARIGVATASLTFFQQIGGTIGLTLAGSLLATRLVTEIPKQLVAAGVPQPVVDGFAGGGAVDLTGTGDLGQRILASVPAAQQPQIAPLIPSIVHGIYEAFSIAIAATFWVGVVGAVIAVVAVAFMHEEPMRTTFDVVETADSAEPATA
ncbi:MAG: MFS transporter, partial [Candidatus Limnocylindrales bacterium]